ncbi:hypothetical protein Taro_016016 [Colocasia esculenta]|uniref:Uncharacterized protein n=1 Tax=Colocasia esculenta TaxID=4460 RepID=A0A843UJ64_COLES|nr:hypothetical protein [Colocasia esculenta]
MVTFGKFRDSLDYANRWRSPHAEPPSHNDRKSCSTRREISSPGRGYGCSNIADIVIPSVYSHPFSEIIGHNFPHGYRNRLCDNKSESALRDGRQGAGFVEFRSAAKIPPRSVCASTPTAVPSGRTRIFILPGVGTAREAPIQNRHFDPVGKWSHSEISGPSPKFLSGSAAADAFAYGHRFTQTGITFRSVIGIAYKAPIRNWHSEALDAPLLPQAIRSRFRVKKPSFRTLKLRF